MSIKYTNKMSGQRKCKVTGNSTEFIQANANVTELLINDPYRKKINNKFVLFSKISIKIEINKDLIIAAYYIDNNKNSYRAISKNTLLLLNNAFEWKNKSLELPKQIMFGYKPSGERQELVKIEHFQHYQIINLNYEKCQ